MRTIHGTTLTTHRGVTLIELCTALAILAILIGLAAPSFAQLQQNATRRAAMDDFWHAIFLARSEAIKRNSVVSLCKSSDGTNCTNASPDWAGGWLVFENLDHDDPAQRDSNEPVLRFYEGHRGIHITTTAGRQTFSYHPNTQGSANGTVVFCDNRGPSAARAIIISHTGRPRQSQRDANNRPLACPLN